MKKKLLVFLGVVVLGGLFSLNVMAQTWKEVTTTYLSNAGFDTEGDWQSEDVAVNTTPKDVTNWTFSGSSSWVGAASFGFGGSAKINGASIPSTNSAGETAGGCLAITGAWNDGSGSGAYTQSVTLPAGSYKLEFMVNNVGQNNNFRKSLFGFNGTYGSTTSYPVDTWTTETVFFSLTSETTGNVSIGYGWPHTGSGNTPKLIVDYVKLYLDTSVDKTELEALLSSANTLYDAGGVGAVEFKSAIDAAQAVYDKDDATAAEVLVAVGALKDAIDEFEWANASVSNPVDITSKIANAGFEAGTGSWTLTKNMGGWVDCAIKTEAPSEGAQCYNLWAGTVASIDLFQTVTLPAGKYTLSADFRIDNIERVTDQGVYVTIEGVTTKSAETITSVADPWNSVEGWNTLSVTFNVLNDDTSVKLGASSTGPSEDSKGWFQVDNFTLKYAGYDNTAALSALSDVITSAKAYTSSVIPDAVYTPLASAISDAEAVVAKGSAASKSEISAVYSALSPLLTSAEECAQPYAKLLALIAKATNEKDNSDADSDVKAALATAVSTAGTNAENVTTAAALNDEFSTLETARQTYVTAATPTGIPLDVTYQIGAVASSKTGWTFTTEAQNQVYKASTEKNTTEYVADGFIENWNGSAFTGKISYTKSGLPAGHYKVVALAFDNVKSGNVYFFANDMSVALSTETNMFTQPVIADVMVAEGANLVFGLDVQDDASNWVGIANVELYYVSLLTEAEKIPAAKASLLGKIEAVVVPAANVGTGAFQIPTGAVETLTNAVSAAQSVYDNADATLAEVESAITALDGAVSTFNAVALNAPADGKLFNVILTYSGWDYDNKAITYLAGNRTDMGNYNIKYSAEANTNLAQAFTFTKVSGNNYTMSQIDADGNVRYICTGTPYGGNTSQLRTTTTADDALEVEVIPTATEGVWNLKNTAANNYIGSQDAGVFTVNSHIDFKIVETTKASVTVNTTVIGWCTLMVPFAVATLPADVKAYTCSDINGTKLVLDPVTALEPNTPYLVQGSWNETLTGDAQGTALTYTEGLLTGVYADMDAIIDSWVLQKQFSTVAFFQVVSGVQPTVKANRCYLTVSSDAPVLRLDGATNIANVEVEAEVVIYDLQGRRVDVPAKGIYIVNGKKVMVK